MYQLGPRSQMRLKGVHPDLVKVVQQAIQITTVDFTVLEGLRGRVTVPISIDTYKAKVAEAGFKAGARILNDVWALRADPELAPVAKAFNVPISLMHNRSNPANVEVRENLGNAYIGSEYENLIEDVKRELLVSVDIARKAGIEESHIILDPGIGFGKKREHNLELINRLDEIRALGYPVLLGPSRKSFIGFTLDLPADQRIEGTAAAVAVAARIAGVGRTPRPRVSRSHRGASRRRGGGSGPLGHLRGASPEDRQPVGVVGDLRGPRRDRRHLGPLPLPRDPFRLRHVHARVSVPDRKSTRLNSSHRT